MITRIQRLIYVLIVLCLAAAAQQAPVATVLFTHARLLDGTGNPWRYADVAVTGDRISFVGDAKTAGITARETMDLHGLYLAPGFIDLHTHTAGGLSRPEMKENLNYLMQGVTTVVTGNDGTSPWPIGATLAQWQRDGIGTNAALFAGFGTIRRQVLQMQDRAPTPEELARMQEMVREGMRDGALGLSSGLFYVPQSWSKTDEVVALAKVAGEMGGLYDTHLRDEDSYSIGVRASVAEALEIGKRGGLPVSISHIKCLGKQAWGCSADVIAMVQKARDEGQVVVANQYPYEASSTAFEAAVVPNWAQVGGRAQLVQRIDDPATREKLLAEIPELIAKRGGPESLVLIGYAADRSLQGKSLAELAKQWNVTPAEAVLRAVRGGSTSVVSHNMSEDDIRNFIRQDWVATGSDGASALPGQLSHPRSWGTFAEKIHKYVEKDRLITLPFAVRAATSLPAEIAGFRQRGLVEPGFFADLVVFDLGQVDSPSTYADPAHYARGFIHVLVNGTFAVRDGQPTHALAGRTLRGPAWTEQRPTGR
jgi:N-acyl-D-amino-acid deacylase